MALTKEDLEAIEALLDRKLDQKLSENNKTILAHIEALSEDMDRKLDQKFSENNKIIMSHISALNQDMDNNFREVGIKLQNLDEKVDKQFSFLLERVEEAEESIDLYTLEIHKLKKQIQ